MKKYMAEFVIDSDIRLPDTVPELSWDNENCGFEITISNSNEGFSKVEGALSANLLFEAPDLNAAKEKSQDLLAKILNSLVWTSASMIRQGKLLRIVDWTPGLAMREAAIFHTVKQQEVSEPLLSSELVETAKKLFDSQQGAETQSALRWYRLGMGAETMEDQFAYFWFALETIAEKLKSSGKVTWKCTKCQGDLYCNNCETNPVHRRFSADSIRDQVIDAYADKEKGLEVYKGLSKMRHTLLHGRKIDAISDRLPFEPEAATSVLAEIARHSILKTGKYQSTGGDKLELHIMENKAVVRGTLMVSANVEVATSGDLTNLSLENIYTPQISIRHPGQPDDE